jgi:hypothetical protein
MRSRGTGYGPDACRVAHVYDPDFACIKRAEESLRLYAELAIGPTTAPGFGAAPRRRRLRSPDLLPAQARRSSRFPSPGR